MIEDALRRHFDGRRASVVDEVWARNAGDALSEDEALTLARSELRAMRQERHDLTERADADPPVLTPAAAVDRVH